MEARFLRSGAVEPQRDQRRLNPTVRMLLVGMGRFVAFVAIAAGVAVGIALAVAAFTDSDAWRAVTLGLYVGGALLVAIPLFSWSGRTASIGGYDVYELPLDAHSRRRWQAQLGAYVAIGMALIGLGVLLEVFRN
jgi:uncharacterized membrane protein YedE/YeeE